MIWVVLVTVAVWTMVEEADPEGPVTGPELLTRVELPARVELLGTTELLGMTVLLARAELLVPLDEAGEEVAGTLALALALDDEAGIDEEAGALLELAIALLAGAEALELELMLMTPLELPIVIVEDQVRVMVEMP